MEDIAALKNACAIFKKKQKKNKKYSKFSNFLLKFIWKLTKSDYLYKYPIGNLNYIMLKLIKIAKMN